MNVRLQIINNDIRSEERATEAMPLVKLQFAVKMAGSFLGSCCHDFYVVCGKIS